MTAIQDNNKFYTNLILLLQSTQPTAETQLEEIWRQCKNDAKITVNTNVAAFKARKPKISAEVTEEKEEIEEDEEFIDEEEEAGVLDEQTADQTDNSTLLAKRQHSGDGSPNASKKRKTSD